MNKLNRPPILLLIFLIVFTVHFTSDTITSTDSRWSIQTSFSLIKEFNLNLDEYKDLAKNDPIVKEVNGHLYTMFPIGTSLLAVPFVFIIDKVLIHLVSFNLEEYLKHTAPGGSIPGGIEVFIASFIVALTALFIYKIGKMFLNTKYSILLVVIFAFCTASWSTASRALWQHGPSMLMLSAALYLVLLSKDRPFFIQFAGIPLAFSYIIRPTNSISIIVLTVFIYVQYRQQFLRYLFGAITIGLPFVIYNLNIHNEILSPYYLPQRIGSNRFFIEALLGNLISPSRGLFVFTPVLLLSLFGIYLKSKKKQLSKLDYCLISIIFLHWIAISSFPHWWAGWSFGPRFFTDVIPYFLYFIIPVLIDLPEFKSIRRLTYYCIFVFLILVSFFINFRGATNPETFAWNKDPVTIDLQTQRLWAWNDIQFMRGLKIAGVEQPQEVVVNSSHSAMIDIGTSADRGFLAQGWSGDEISDENVTFKWADNLTSVLHVNLSKADSLTLEFRAAPFVTPSKKQQQVSLFINGYFVEKVVLTEGWNNYQIKLPRNQIVDGIDELVFKYSYAVSPKEFSTNQDTRTLAVAFDYIKLSK